MARTIDLPLPIQTMEGVLRRGGYVLRDTDYAGCTGLSLWLDYDGESTLITEDLPRTAVEDFDYYVDCAVEEINSLYRQAREEFGL